MVHALDEIRRVLVPGGSLLDVRPINDRWPVEVISGRGAQETGRLDDAPEPLKSDIAANKAMQEVEARGWFQREREEIFPFFYSWDTPSEMEKFLTEDWSDFIELSEEVKKATRAAWAVDDADSRVRVRVKILISRWRVTDAGRNAYQKNTDGQDGSAPGPVAPPEA